MHFSDVAHPTHCNSLKLGFMERKIGCCSAHIIPVSWFRFMVSVMITLIKSGLKIGVNEESALNSHMGDLSLLVFL